MRIREATVADASAIAEVHITAWRVTYAGIVYGFLLGVLYPAMGRMLRRRSLDVDG